MKMSENSGGTDKKLSVNHKQIPTGITQNIKDLLASREIENIFENSDFIYMLNQAAIQNKFPKKSIFFHFLGLLLRKYCIECTFI